MSRRSARKLKRSTERHNAGGRAENGAKKEGEEEEKEEEKEDWWRLGEERRGTRGRLRGHFRRREFESHCGNTFFHEPRSRESQRHGRLSVLTSTVAVGTRQGLGGSPGYRPELDKGSDLSTANHDPGRRPLPTRRQDQDGG
ncbi:hypothetical protein CSAL01_09390 [Colletotrichum salicis]|uniref:Uncharacterized protein n=1 Tax=Colletotrichum salicis TaxID=1209931 RepID=A0A135V1W3_9PEZI|nr:hypothetical protein CSAL01_09390 [Colletotrichum salicis]